MDESSVESNKKNVFNITRPMDNVVIVVLTVALVGLVFVTVWNKKRREGLEDVSYNEETCLTLAQKNDKGIQDLEEKIKKISKLEDMVSTAKLQCDANTTNILKLIEMCRK